MSKLKSRALRICKQGGQPRNHNGALRILDSEDTHLHRRDTQAVLRVTDGIYKYMPKQAFQRKDWKEERGLLTLLHPTPPIPQTPLPKPHLSHFYHKSEKKWHFKNQL